MSDTPTPRVDEEIVHLLDDTMNEVEAVPAPFARQLERELAAKDAQADKIHKAWVDLAAKLEADLEKERALADRLANAMFGCPSTECDNALAAWKEARK